MWGYSRTPSLSSCAAGVPRRRGNSPALTSPCYPPRREDIHMRTQGLVIVATLLASVGTAQAEPSSARLLIWGGGATRADADASLATYRERAKEWDGVVTLAEGHPRIVESRSVPGLKPGFVVVVLGACAPEAGSKLLADFKAFEPAVYSRDVTWSDSTFAILGRAEEALRPQRPEEERGRRGCRPAGKTHRSSQQRTGCAEPSGGCRRS
jgi:hypothetical protein